MRGLPHGVSLASGLALALLVGCPESKREAEPSAASPDASPRSTGLRSGVKVPLPSGWSAQVAADGSFQAGPPGRSSLRVDLRPGQGEQLPSARALTQAMRGPLKDFVVTSEQEEGTEDFTLVRGALAPKLGDGGVGSPAPAFFAARRVGQDLFLCASLPGASAEEVRLGADACRDIQVQAAPR
ncbi:hypothetical protein JGU66_08475 [Myxococcaceae bacterium JPH2]|nr:hypothetical protein [Myxococcaceae bacterium JPH2]